MDGVRGIQDAVVKLFNTAMDTPVGAAAAERAGAAKDSALQAQEMLLAALNLPTATEMERLFAQLRSISQRLEDLEDAVDDLADRLSRQPQR